LRMKFGDEYHRISAAWLWNRVVDRRKARGNRDGAESLGYIRGGYKRLFDRLKEEIRQKGGEILAGQPVEELCLEQQRCSGVRSGGVQFCSDAVLVTLPLPKLLEIAPCLPRDYEASLRSIAYQGSTCVVLKLRSALSQYYWINVSDAKSPFVGVIEHTNLVPAGFYGDRNIVYLTRYSSSNDTIFARGTGEIYDEFTTFLGHMFPQFTRSDVEQYWVFQDRFSQPVFVKNYSKIMPRYAAPLDGLYLLGTAQLYPESRCLNSSIAKAAQVVNLIRDSAGPAARTDKAIR
jgi:protoporphyrinogen oxidase